MTKDGKSRCICRFCTIFPGSSLFQDNEKSRLVQRNMFQVDILHGCGNKEGAGY